MELGSCAAQVVGADLEAKMEALHALGYDFIEPTWRDEVMTQLGEGYGNELRKMGERTGCPVKSAIFAVFSDMGTRLGTPESRAAELEQFTRACQTMATAGGDVLLLNNWAG